MTLKLHVGNLPFATTARELHGLFSQSGAVANVELICDRITGRSRGFAFVTMGAPEAAKLAMESLNGHDLGGRAISVNAAKPKEPRQRVFSSGGRERVQ